MIGFVLICELIAIVRHVFPANRIVRDAPTRHITIQLVQVCGHIARLRLAVMTVPVSDNAALLRASS